MSIKTNAGTIDSIVEFFTQSGTKTLVGYRASYAVGDPGYIVLLVGFSGTDFAAPGAVTATLEGPGYPATGLNDQQWHAVCAKWDGHRFMTHPERLSRLSVIAWQGNHALSQEQKAELFRDYARQFGIWPD